MTINDLNSVRGGSMSSRMYTACVTAMLTARGWPHEVAAALAHEKATFYRQAIAAGDPLRRRVR